MHVNIIPSSENFCECWNCRMRPDKIALKRIEMPLSKIMGE